MNALGQQTTAASAESDGDGEAAAVAELAVAAGDDADVDDADGSEEGDQTWFVNGAVRYVMIRPSDASASENTAIPAAIPARSRQAVEVYAAAQLEVAEARPSVSASVRKTGDGVQLVARDKCAVELSWGVALDSGEAEGVDAVRPEDRKVCEGRYSLVAYEPEDVREAGRENVGMYFEARLRLETMVVPCPKVQSAWAEKRSGDLHTV